MRQQRAEGPAGRREAIDGQIADMQAVLAMMNRTNAAEALKALRAAFPKVIVGPAAGQITEPRIP